MRQRVRSSSVSRLLQQDTAEFGNGNISQIDFQVRHIRQYDTLPGNEIRGLIKPLWFRIARYVSSSF